MALRVNIPSQVILISLEKEWRRKRKQEEERLLRRQEGGKRNEESKERSCQGKVGDSGSRGTKTQTKIKDHEIKKVRKGRKGGEVKKQKKGALLGRGGV